MKKTWILAAGIALILTACSDKTESNEHINDNEHPIHEQNGGNQTNHPTGSDSDDPTSDGNSEPKPGTNDPSHGGGVNGHPGDSGDSNDSVQTVTEPESISVLVNKQLALPDNYKPNDLVYPDVHFIFSDKVEKRMMRQEAATALEQMFKGAEEQDIFLGGVSAYRSHDTQKALFNRYVQKDGIEKAKTYSAVPGHSEHETGLAIDVSGSDGACAASDCFGDTQEAQWLAQHAHEYGFIIRYPEGKEHITGYQYEPWHLRYVGKSIAQEVFERDITLEEYFDAVPVTN